MRLSIAKLAKLALLTLCLSSTLHAQQRPTSELLVLSKQDHTLSTVDLATLRVIAKFPVGDDPHEVVATPDAHTAYVSNYGLGALRTITQVDLTGHTPPIPIDLGPLTGPHGLAYVDGHLWFTTEGANAVARYDPAVHKVDLVLSTGQDRTHMIHVAPGERRIIVTNVTSGTITFFDRKPNLSTPPRPISTAISGGTVQHPSVPQLQDPTPASPTSPAQWSQVNVKAGNGVEGFDISPDGREVWAANAQDDTITILDGQTKTVIATIPSSVSKANRLKFTPDGTHVLVSGLDDPNLVVLDTRTRQVIKRIPIGHGAAGIALETNGARAFVACTPDNYIAVIDLPALRVVGRISAGDRPDGLAFVATRYARRQAP